MANDNQTYWICRGFKQEPHPEEEVAIAERCPICSRNHDSMRTSDSSVLPLGKILGGVTLLALIVGCALLFLDDQLISLLNSDTASTDLNSPQRTTNKQPNNNINNLNNRVDYTWQPEKFTWGQRSLFTDKTSPNLNNGIAAFQKEDYQNAIAFLEKAVTANRNDPEPLILLNNARARQQGNPLTLAAVVPVTGNIDSAKEMLRGVAMAQKKFNFFDGKEGRLLEIVIADDQNNPEIAAQVAQQLANDPSILGVIGHNSSAASQAGLEIYEAHDLAMISPTSTSTSLQSNLFFRTTTSDIAAAKKLAQYVTRQLQIPQVVIFYNPHSEYSKSLKENFESRFKGDVVKSIDLSVDHFNAVKRVRESVFEAEAQAALLFPDTQTVEVAREIAIANSQIKPDKRKLKLIGGDSLYNPDTLINGGENVRGLVLAVPWSIQSRASQKFKEDGYQQWGASVNWRTAMSYDATQAFISSFSPQKNTRSSIIDAIRKVKLQPTRTSGIEVRFTPQGERQSDPVLVEVSQNVLDKPYEAEFGFKLIPTYDSIY